MKKIIGTLLLMIFSLGFINAQEEESSFRLELSTQRIYSLGTNSEGFLETSFYIVSKKLYNYSIHLSGFWDLNERLELGVGAGFSNRDAYFDINCDFCYQPAKVPSSGEFIGRVGYVKRRALEVPIELRLNWIKDAKVLDPFVAFGVTNRLPIFYYFADRVKFDLESYGIGLSLLMGTKVNLGKKWGLVSSVALTRNEAYVLNNNLFGPIDDFNNIDTKYEFWVKLGARRDF